jgi:hypothetical protein
MLDDNYPRIGSAAYLRLLADCLDGQEEVILGPTDHEFCALGLRALADLIETNLA